MQVIDGIYQLITPFPEYTLETAKQLRTELEAAPRILKGLPYVMPYMIKSGGDVALVDCGWNTDAAYAALTEGMQEHGSHPTEIQKLFITHVHPDHYGMSGRLKQLSSCEVIIHEKDADVINSRYLSPRGLTQDMGRFMEMNGVPPMDAPNMSQGSMNMIDRVFPAPPDQEVKGGEVMKIGEFDFELIWTPGHSPGHICLYERNRKVLITGDHVLPSITPNVSIHAQTSGTPLGDYIRSLDKLVELDVQHCLPAHEYPIKHLQTRLKEIADHHEIRLDEMYRAIDSGGSTAWDVAGRVKWATGTLAEFQPHIQRSAVGETIAHLEYLYEQGRLAKVMRAGVVHWLPIA